MKVFKYQIEVVNELMILMPKDARILHVGLDGYGDPCFWALLEPLAESEKRFFYVYGTGMEVRDNLDYLGTWVKGDFLWHLFEDILARGPK